MVGLIITSIIIVTVIPWGMRIITLYHHSFSILRQATECEAARTIIMRTIIAGSQNKTAWYFESDRFALRSQDGKWHGFVVRNNIFVHIASSENPFLSESVHHHVVPLMRNITECSITPVYYNDKLTSVAISIKHKTNDYLIKGCPRYAYN